MLHPTVFNTAQICAELGVKHAVISPGSRNAPLTISFARHDKIQSWSVPDERSAAFIALGIAEETQSPVALCCTSGTALLNYGPAIAEAYYKQVPLIVLSADRPPELIDQRDGQTIRQFEALKNHVKSSHQLPVIEGDAQSASFEDTMIHAIKHTFELPFGPVHINVPFREPFYPSKDQKLAYTPLNLDTKHETLLPTEEIDLSSFQKILILVGQQPKNELLDRQLLTLGEQIPVIKTPLNNLAGGIEHVDAFIDDQTGLQPDLLITSGLSVLSKKLKQYLRKFKPGRHLHFDPGGIEVDTFGSDPELIPEDLAASIDNITFGSIDKSFLDSWNEYSSRVKAALSNVFEGAPFSESKAAHQILKSIPSHSTLHLSNSMPVRYAELFGVGPNIEVRSNRGTSGIDGCTSTVLGTSLVSDKIQVLMTGDLAFLYDRNAFFHNYHFPNLRVIILNNQGGGIFRLIDGPAQLAELETFFETRHNRTAEYLCAENDIEYLKATDEATLHDHLSSFYEKSDRAKVLEVMTDPNVNQQSYKALKQYIHEQTHH